MPSGNVYFSGHHSDLGEHRPETPIRKSSGPAARDVAGNRHGQWRIPGQSALWPSVNVPVTGTVYQLRVVLAGISPLVWRRLLVPAETSVAGLHEILQTAFGWSDEHLHRFTIHAVEYGLWRPGSAGFSRDARQVRLDSFGLRRGERFTYEYNFTAGWRHDIRVEEILPRSPRRRYPACTGGARQAPPEHFGSPEEFLALRQRWPPALIAIRMARDPRRPDGRRRRRARRRGDRRVPR